MAAENQLCGKGYELTLFLFTDLLVVAKRKSTKGLSISRSPSTASLAGTGVGQGSVLQTKVGAGRTADMFRWTLDSAENCYVYLH